MKLNRWLWAGVLLVLACTAASCMPLREPFPLLQPDAASKTEQGHTQAASASVCQTARPAVVTLYASTEFGSGSIVSPQGLVLTNYHVVQAAGDGQIRARGWSGSLFKGQVIATDPDNDLALVQLDTREPLPEIRFAKATTFQAGQAVCAIGSPLGRTGIITWGTLKGTNENGDLQSSILLHPGNSGGPLLNQQGEMIGVNKAIWLSETGENVGIGFATATAIAQAFIEQNRPTATAIAQQSGFPAQDTLPQAPVSFGLDIPIKPPSAANLSPKASITTQLGALINEQSLVIQLVEPNSPAENAGLSAGDRLVAVDRQPLSRLEDLETFLNRRPSSAVFTISRDQQQQEIYLNF
ncbi:trypsin-like peptidase domain-containing protein [Leptolyngbya sp. FACHB-321]|uniref:S1C family serine protease n=1 Tax=Leptolyngbya sp. FACHB-321 TaxID=2692807 RepID=UPI00168980EA|nr:trypsin-like peptidase domain-containing protein [Leptolyngbya sp. FACHB-321]MBD2035503.1 trypsin-like peptidase domain-containing protein [Leptolyngbya sp. FACHB-321]